MSFFRMDSKDPNVDGRGLKFGLPSWMVNNIERLNSVIDFEQYACSPPETESFLTEHSDHCDFHDVSEPYSPVAISNDIIEEKSKLTFEIKGEELGKYSLVNSTKRVSPTVNIINNLKHEEIFSSPESTPCATPEPSPAPRRKLSGQQDTVQSNPGKWFYLGNTRKGYNMKGQTLNASSNKGNRKKSSEKLNDSPIKTKDTVAPKKDSIKLAISNFDINAISPSSW